MTPVVVENCKGWCENHDATWDVKCTWVVNCAGCSACQDGV
eukprot:CAMPEP_0172511868 /NCGR_PEP_ID=MMETSP1066-20121228/239928_1 /TAXON_ID=671091 /ORGANISM="Coscinodiscus wailesii, Strain CCMP2513" /LENGTH=40 /DNA_ID= /DNA_START= /DNA_END= /DNA_ORIENTATION=